MIDGSTIAVALIMGMAQIGAAKLVVDRTFKTLDETTAKTANNTVLIAETVKTLERVQASINEHAAAEKELFASRNDHDNKLTAIDTLHEARGCKTLYQKQHKEPANVGI